MRLGQSIAALWSTTSSTGLCQTCGGAHSLLDVPAGECGAIK